MRRHCLALLVPLVAVVVAGCGSSSHTATRSARPGATGPSSATAATGATGATSGAPAAASGRCTPQQLHLAYLASQGATGHIEARFELRNASKSTCTMFGYPGAQMLSAKGSRLPTTVQRGGAFFANTRRRPQKVTLAPGKAAGFVLGYSDNPELGSGTSGPRPCPAAAKLEVTPPNAFSQLVVTFPAGESFAPCGGVLIASPVY